MAARKPPVDPMEIVRELGRQGGKKRAENLTPTRRREIAKKAADARWQKKSKPRSK